jgi:Helix-turn-helix.
MGNGNANVPVDGDALRRSRHLAGLSITALAGQASCSVAYVSMLETGARRYCSPALFARIADALGVEDRSTLLREPERSAA